jgi:hypothetical protein
MKTVIAFVVYNSIWILGLLVGMEYGMGWGILAGLGAAIIVVSIASYFGWLDNSSHSSLGHSSLSEGW